MKCIFVSDLHGSKKRFDMLFKIIEKEQPDGVFIGGDVLPNQFKINNPVNEFLEDCFFSKIKKLRYNPYFFIIFGNDDPRAYEQIMINADKKGIINYVNNKTVNFNNLFVFGYSYVPPTPFQLKDWEKYDISRFVDVGAISPEDGIRTFDVDIDEIKYSTISDDLKKLLKNKHIDKTIFLFHSPPYNSFLDRALLDGKNVDHAPVDVHVGSIAIRNFIEKKQPFLTLHGHVHETVSLTGRWMEKFGKTFSFSACHDGKELAVVLFDTEDLENAVRILV